MGISRIARAGAVRQLMVRVKPSGQPNAPSLSREAPFVDILNRYNARVEAITGAVRGPEGLRNGPSVSGTGEEPELSRYLHIIATEDQLESLRDELAHHPSVEAAYLKPPGQPPVIDFDRRPSPQVSNTPDFSDRQAYLGPAPVGVDALYSWGIRGGAGAGISVVDCEWAWNFSHEDLSTHCNGAVVGTPGTSDFDHGTAVIGTVVGNANAFGITGIAHDAQLSTACFDDFGATSTSKIITQAADKLSAGDVLLLEIHRPGPRTPNPEQGQLGYIAIEWWPDDFAAIRYAVAKGILVVEAAGNGFQDLDDPVYSIVPQGFPPDWRNPFSVGGPDSGAIVVGAGNPPAGTHGRSSDTLGFGEVYVDRARCSFSNFGNRVDCQGWGWEVTTLGYGDFYPGAGTGIQASDQNRLYTDVFAGTSSASPMIVGVLACTQGALKAAGRPLLAPDSAREILRTTGSLQQSADGRPATQKIGNRPDLRAIITSLSRSNSRTIAAPQGTTKPVTSEEPSRNRSLAGVSKVGIFGVLFVTLLMAQHIVTVPWLTNSPFLAWIIDLVFVALFMIGVGKRIQNNWMGAVVDSRNRISLSRLQIVVWTILFVATFLVAFSWNATREASTVTLVVPDTVWLLMGISGVTAAGGPLVLSQKPGAPHVPAPLPPPGMLASGVIVTRAKGGDPQWTDLIAGDELGNATTIDVGKVQQLLLSAVAAVSYGLSIAKLLYDTAEVSSITELPKMDSGFLSLLAASSATYLGYKAVPHT